MLRFNKQEFIKSEGEKKLHNNKIYAIDLPNIVLKLIDIKREIFKTLKKTMLYQN